MNSHTNANDNSGTPNNRSTPIGTEIITPPNGTVPNDTGLLPNDPTAAQAMMFRGQSDSQSIFVNSPSQPSHELSLKAKSKAKSRSTTKNKDKTTRKKDDNPKLKMIKDLVEGQPTKELQNMLFVFTEETLVSLMTIKKRQQGAAKVRSSDDYIPQSVCFDCSLQ